MVICNSVLLGYGRSTCQKCIFYKLIGPYSNFVRCHQNVYIIDKGVAILQYGSYMGLKTDLQQNEFFIIDLCSKSVLKNEVKLLAGLSSPSSKADETVQSCSMATGRNVDHKTSLMLKIASLTSGETI